jgi:threonine dehydrogenase-like Zn-dependent dehydrogenase
VYGGATAVGAYAIKLASLSNIHPIIAIAGNGIPYVQSLLDPKKGDVVIDYRKGADYIVEELRKATSTATTTSPGAVHALDAVSERGSITTLGKALGPGSKIATVLTQEMALGGTEDPGHCEVLFTMVGTVHQDAPGDARFGNREFGAMFFPYFGLGLAEGWFRGHPYEVVPGGLDGLQEALSVLEGGKLSASKLVLRIAETEGASRA